MRWRFAVFAALLLVLAVPFGHAQQACNATYQCNEGYCQNSTCTVPEFTVADYHGPCNKTIDCEFGFCYKSQCTSPKPVTSIINIEPKSGCTGFVELVPGGVGTYVCDFMWVILVGAAILAGFFARSFGIVILAVSLALPLALGLFVAPVAGVAAAIVEIVLLIWRRKSQVSTLAKKAEAAIERKREMEILDADEKEPGATVLSKEQDKPSQQPMEKENSQVDEDLPPNWVEPEPIEPIKK
ncbi:MAG: hypothetical protein WC506_02895 [Candidatus Micrarchaeia archaeon]